MLRMRSLSTSNRPRRSGRRKFSRPSGGSSDPPRTSFSAEDFSYDQANDVYICPGGKTLTTTGTRVNDGDTLLYRASKADCDACALRSRCCPNTPARKVPRSIHEHARDMAREIGKSWEGRVSRRLRKKIEMLFAHLN